MLCRHCGTVLDAPQSATRYLSNTDRLVDDPMMRLGTARFNTRTFLVLTVRDNAASFEFAIDEIIELTIGRRNIDTGEKPTLDLHPYQAAEKGVSRMHALITHRNGSLYVTDRSSPNGTYLNGQRLIPNQPRVLRDGDDLRLGNLLLQAHFSRQSR